MKILNYSFAHKRDTQNDTTFLSQFGFYLGMFVKLELSLFWSVNQSVRVSHSVLR